MTRLQVGHLSLSLAKKPITSFANLLTQSKKYINAEEIEMARRQVDRSQVDFQLAREKP